MGFQDSINSATAAVGKLAAIGKGVSTYAKEQNLKEAAKKEDIINQGTALQEEGTQLNQEKLAAKREMKNAQQKVEDEDFKYNQDLMNDPYRASDVNLEKARAELQRLQDNKRVQQQSFKQRKEALKSKIEAHNKVAKMYGVQGIQLKGGKK